MIRLVFISCLLIGCLSGCGSGDGNQQAEAASANDTTIQAEQEAPPPVADFRPMELEAGDQWEGMTVQRINPGSPAVDDRGNWVGTVDMRGQVTVSGIYMMHPAFPDNQRPCFEIIDMTERRKFPFSTTRALICFENEDKALAELGEVGKVYPATISIDNFTYYRTPKEDPNTAELIQVIERDTSGLSN